MNPTIAIQNAHALSSELSHLHTPAVDRTFFCTTLGTLRTSHACEHIRMAQGCMKRVFTVCMSCLSISPSPLSCFTRLPCCSPTDTSTTSSRPSRPHRLCWAYSDPKARDQRNSALVRRSLATWPTCPTAHPNRLVIANQNAHSFGRSSVLARQKMKTKSRSLVVAMSNIMVASRPRSIHHRFSDSSVSWPLRARKFFKSSSRIVMRIGKCQDRSVGRIQTSLFWSSRTLLD